MNAKQLFVIITGVAIAGAVVYYQSTSNVVPPDPNPPGPVITGIAEVAANDGATYLAAYGANCGTVADKIRSGEFKTCDQAHDELKRLNAASRLAAFTPWHTQIQVAVDAKDVAKLADLLEQSKVGFPAAIKTR